MDIFLKTKFKEEKIMKATEREIELINAAYEGELTDVCTSDEFIELADCLSHVKFAEGLSNEISYIFDKLTYSERGIDTLLPLIEEYNPNKFTSPDNTFIGKYIIENTKTDLTVPNCYYWPPYIKKIAKNVVFIN